MGKWIQLQNEDGLNLDQVSRILYHDTTIEAVLPSGERIILINSLKAAELKTYYDRVIMPLFRFEDDY